MENNEQSNNMAKKGVGLLIIIGALLIVVMGLGGYILYDKFGETKETENTEEKKDDKKEEKETALNDNAVKEQLAKSIAILEGAELYQDGGKSGYYFQGDVYAKNIKTEEMSDEVKLYAVLKYAFNNNIDFTIDYTAAYPGNSTKVADGEKINKLYKSVYGYSIKNYKPKESGCPIFTYDESSKKYKGIYACGGTSPCWLDTYINNYTVSGDNYYVYVSLGSSCTEDESYSNEKYYSDYARTNELDQKYDIKTNKDKFSEYKYTFTKTKDGDYKFVSVEKVK